jgi:hypothetical protein
LEDGRSEVERAGVGVSLTLVFDDKLFNYDLEGTQTDLLEVLQDGKELSKYCRDGLL